MSDLSYTKWDSMSDKAIAEKLGAFIKHHRVERNQTQDDLANAAGMSRSTLSLLERGESVTLSTLLQVLRVLDLLHVLDVFQVSETISPLAMAKITKYKRSRARTKKQS